MHRRQHDRYRVQGLLADYAAMLPESEVAERGRDWQRLFEWYRLATERATGLLYPDASRAVPSRPVADVPTSDIVDRVAARTWLETERATLVAVARQWTESALREAACWQFVERFRVYLDMNQCDAELAVVAEAARTVGGKQWTAPAKW